MLRTITSFLALATLMMFAGCASGKSGAAKDNRSDEQKLHQGMTKQEVIDALGPPDGKSMNSSGTETWTYTDTAKAFIPFYAIGGGKFLTLMINFDAEGKLKDWSSSRQGIY